jgi:hypothetical protein
MYLKAKTEIEELKQTLEIQQPKELIEIIPINHIKTETIIETF